MRSARGYLDTLVRSARPPGPNVETRAAVQPDWGPTRFAEVPDEPAPAAPTRPVTPPRRSTERASEPGPTRESLPVEQSKSATDAASRRSQTPAEPRIPTDATPALPVEPAAVPTARPASGARVEAAEPRPASASVHPEARIGESRPAPTPPREVARPASLRLPPGTEAALERLEHLTRRFSAAYPPAPVDAEPAAAPELPTVAAGPETSRAKTSVVTLEPAPAFAAEAPTRDRERVEIGSIEVFVTQPPSPAPVPASVAAPQVMAIAPLARLSRPAQAYGFGQG